MRVIIQRVKHASVTIDNQLFNKIDQGFLLLVGICDEDNEEIASKMAKKICELRIFEDENDKMNLGIQEIGGKILSISQFTLYADCKKGRRPSFVKASRPEKAKPLYEYFNNCLNDNGVETFPGIFGADMKVDLLNDGPVTIILDSKEVF